MQMGISLTPILSLLVILIPAINWMALLYTVGYLLPGLTGDVILSYVIPVSICFQGVTIPVVLIQLDLQPWVLGLIFMLCQMNHLFLKSLSVGKLLINSTLIIRTWVNWTDNADFDQGQLITSNMNAFINMRVMACAFSFIDNIYYLK